MESRTSKAPLTQALAALDALLNADSRVLPPDQAEAMLGEGLTMASWIEGPPAQRALLLPDGRVLVTRFNDAAPQQRPYLAALQDAVADQARVPELEARVSDRDRMFQSVLDTIPVRVFWKDLDGAYLGCNQRFADDAGEDSPQAMIGKNDYQMPWGPEADAYRSDDAKVTQSGQAKIDFEEPQTTPQGEQIWLQTSKIPLKDHRGATTGILGTYTEITARKRAEAQREELLSQLEDKNVELERFTYTVSHDLKSPLVTIQGFVGVLQEELELLPKLDPETARLVAMSMSRIQSATISMQDMLDELLEMSRVGRVLGERRPQNLGPLVQQALAHCAGILEEAGATVEVSEGLPTVHVDGARMVQVLQNLIENACKYRAAYRPLKLDFVGRADGSLAVSDNGIGIAEQHRKRVFGLFEKLDESTPGNGIGLALVHRILKSHGGSVHIESGPNQFGTCVVLSFPSTNLGPGH